MSAAPSSTKCSLLFFWIIDQLGWRSFKKGPRICLWSHPGESGIIWDYAGSSITADSALPFLLITNHIAPMFRHFNSTQDCGECVHPPLVRRSSFSSGLQQRVLAKSFQFPTTPLHHQPFILSWGLTSNLLTPWACTQPGLNLEILFTEVKANRLSPLLLEIRVPLKTSEVTISKVL